MCAGWNVPGSGYLTRSFHPSEVFWISRGSVLTLLHDFCIIWSGSLTAFLVRRGLATSITYNHYYDGSLLVLVTKHTCSVLRTNSRGHPVQGCEMTCTICTYKHTTWVKYLCVYVYTHSTKWRAPKVMKSLRSHSGIASTNLRGSSTKQNAMLAVNKL